MTQLRPLSALLGPVRTYCESCTRRKIKRRGCRRVSLAQLSTPCSVLSLQVKALLLVASSAEAGPQGSGPREASTDDLLDAAKVLIKSRELLDVLSGKLAATAVPVRLLQSWRQQAVFACSGLINGFGLAHVITCS